MKPRDGLWLDYSDNNGSHYRIYIVRYHRTNAGGYTPLHVLDYVSLTSRRYIQREEIDLMFYEEFIPTEGDVRKTMEAVFN
jgi:hypothetical protein